MFKEPPPAPTTNIIGPCPTIVKLVGCPGAENYPAISPDPTLHPPPPRPPPLSG